MSTRPLASRALIVLAITSAPLAPPRALASSRETASRFLANAPKRMARGLSEEHVSRTYFHTSKAEHLAEFSRGADTLRRDPGALEALGDVLRSRALPRDLLVALIANPRLTAALPRLTYSLRDVATVPGARNLVTRLAAANDDAMARGGLLELQAGAALARRSQRRSGESLASITENYCGHECDGLLIEKERLRVVAVHSTSTRRTGTPLPLIALSERNELAERLTAIKQTTGKRANAMIIIGLAPGAAMPRRNWYRDAYALDAHLRVLYLNEETGDIREVFSGGPAHPPPRASTRAAERDWGF